MAYLYINSKGQEVRRHSNSGGSTFHFCARKYKLERPDGWKERERKASKLFGIAVESAIRFHHENGLSGGPAEFARLWGKLRDDKELAYNPVEQSWENLALVGDEMLRLYDIRLPSLPFDLRVQPRFQVPYEKEVFSGTKLAGITFNAYVDMIGVAHPEHPLLPKAPLPVWEGTSVARPTPRRLFVDIKTSGESLDPTPGIVVLDQQLRDYSWVTDIADGAFLWFTKKGRALKRGDEVTLLQPDGEFKAGDTAIVLFVGELTAVLLPSDLYRQFEDESKNLKGKKLDGLKEAYGQNPRAVGASFGCVTKQRLVFAAGRFSLDDRAESAAQIGHDIAQIVHASETNFWPKQGGVRFPNKKCTFCPMRGICLGNDGLRDKLVFRDDKEWDLAAESAEAE